MFYFVLQSSIGQFNHRNFISSIVNSYERMIKMWALIIIALQFLSGSIMYSHLIARALGVELNKVWDGNPGSSNLWRAKGWKYGLTALLLDYSKGTFPLFLFVRFEILTNSYLISAAALAGVLGHAFSPWLKFKGGKAIATSFGAWSVLTKWEGPVLLGSVFTLFSIFKKKTSPQDDSFRVMLGFMVLFLYVLYKFVTGQKHLLPFYIANLMLILYKHWKDLVSYFKKSLNHVE